ncbi:MAG: hypothetical protein C4548_11875 [Desulfobacteraceae bacterium]|nr:MAG: hypothetical protein C4548_11875 [Desulfobacteraceae bacterium]
MKKIGLTLFILIIIGLLPAVGGCGKKAPPPMDPFGVDPASDTNTISQLNEHIFASATLTTGRSEYLIGPGDLLEIKIFEAEKLNTTVRVNSRGMVSLPLLGEIAIGGLTAIETERFIQEQYKASYIRDPHVSIFIREHFSQKVTVIGQVRNPGTYDYPSKQRLLDALALAGGLTDRAGRNVQIRRYSDMAIDIPQSTFLVNIDQLINEGRTELNVHVNGGDIIYVPEAGLFFVDGAIRRPGEYIIKKTMSIKEAVYAAGGLEPFADPRELIILRATEDGKRKEIKVNLEDEGEEAHPLMIQDKDIIMVNARFWGKVFHGLGLNIGLPGLGFSYRDPSR